MRPESQANIITDRVLLVDDDEAILQSLRRVLRREPYETLTAFSGAQALEILAQTRVDVVVSDERMPGISGADFLAQVGRDYPDVMRILMTGSATLDETARILGSGGIYRFLSKPVGTDVLARTLQNALQMRRLMSERARLPLASGGPR